MGCDEVNMACWREVPSIALFMAEKNYSEKDLLGYFMNRVIGILQKYNRKIIAWEDSVIAHQVFPKVCKARKRDVNEGEEMQNVTKQDVKLENSNVKEGIPAYLKNFVLDESLIFQVWRNPLSAEYLFGKGYPILSSLYTSWYLDVGQAHWISHPADDSSMTCGGQLHFDPTVTSPVIPWQKMYSMDPTAGLSPASKPFVLGGEVALWTEMTNEANVDGIVWPRAVAVAERLWSLAVVDKIVVSDETTNRLDYHGLRLARRGLKVAPLRPTFCSLFPLYAR